MTDRQIIKRRIDKDLVNNITIAERLMDVANNVLSSNVDVNTVSTLYIALEEIKVLYDVYDKNVNKAYNNTMKSYRERLNDNR